jgi:hypothetical protein
MGWPAGDCIFRMGSTLDNAVGEFSIRFREKGVPYEQASLELSDGVCAAITALWIRRSLETAGDIKSLSDIGSFRQILIAQAAYEQALSRVNARGPLPKYKSQSDKSDNWALTLQGIKIEDADSFEHTRENVQRFLEKIVAGGGFYCLSLEVEDEPTCHQVGFKTNSPNLNGYWTFDAQKGLYHTRDQKWFVSESINYLYGPGSFADVDKTIWYKCGW